MIGLRSDFGFDLIICLILNLSSSLKFNNSLETIFSPESISMYDDAPKGGFKQRRVSRAVAATDTRSARLKWFLACLLTLTSVIPNEGRNVAFPARIGCDLTGGEWPQYREAIKKFAGEDAVVTLIAEGDPPTSITVQIREFM